MFNWFKKKKKEEYKPNFDPSDLSVSKLKKGAFLDYNLETWQVTAQYEYDWGNEYFTDEFQLKNIDQVYYLYLQEDDELQCQWLQKINPRQIDPQLTQHIKTHDVPPSEILYEGTRYFRGRESVGYFRNIENDNWEEFIVWVYYDEKDEKVMHIERWDEDEFEATVGIILKEYEFSNIILP